MMKARALALLIALCALALPAIAAAHGRSTSYLSFSIEGSSAVVRARMALIDRTALEASWASRDPRESAASALPVSVTLAGPQGVCAPEPSSFRELASEVGWSAFEWRARCVVGKDGQPFAPTKARSDLFFDILPAHVAFVRVRDASRASDEAEYVLTETRREALLPSHEPLATEAPQSSLATAARFVRAGIEHLLTGWDHLAFLFAILLAAGSFRAAALALTGFTIGHSVTLSLAVFGYAAPRASTVEALIAASIALVAVENVWIADGRAAHRLPAFAVLALALLAPLGALVGSVSPLALLGTAIFEGFCIALLARSPKPEDLRGIAAAFFGLLHGFGFAGILGQMDLGRGAPILPLASFNIGIEIGQLAIACAAWPLLLALRRRWDAALLVRQGSAVPLSLGVYWLISRVFG
jgi:hypothetical protein